MKYIVVQESSLKTLTETVTEMLQQGWKPLGGVSMAVDQGRHEYAQAMIKESVS